MLNPIAELVIGLAAAGIFILVAYIMFNRRR